MGERPLDLTTVAVGYHKELTSAGRKWLNDRGLTDDTIRGSLLGEVVTPASEHERFQGAISIPYWNPSRTVRSLRFRNLRDGTHKYDSVAGESVHIFNVANTGLPKVWICEGEFDALVLSQLGFSAVGIPGAGGFKPEWKYLFSHCTQVSIAFDGDDAGLKGARRISSLLGDVCDNIRILALPPGIDCNDIYIKSPDELIARMR